MVSNNAYQFINLDYLELMSDGDDSMKKVLLEMLIAELPDEIVKMRSLQQSSNWDCLLYTSPSPRDRG